MKKILFIPLLAMQLHALEIEHDGYIRVGYQTFNNESDTVDEKDMSIGGKFNLELIANENFRVGATLLSTNALIEPSGYGVPFYSTNLSSYTILAEAYLKANFSKTLLTIGRQELDTPYAQPDDVAMVPNRFEGVTLKSNEIEDTTLLLGYLTKWSGMDSAQDRAHFSKMNGDDGVWMANITYKGIENLKLQAWLYAMDNFA
ncbi:MAG: OprD family outer membrane porin, partial [Campylobacterota bacterium]|nr:OprD family outer membrane porin [Campylobacterota bacterium]